MKNIKKMTLIALLGSGIFVPTVKAYPADQSIVNTRINVLQV